MLLHHLFNLHEEHGVMPLKVSIPSFTHGKVIGIIDGEDVWASRCFEGLMSIGIQHDGSCIAFISFTAEETMPGMLGMPGVHQLYQMWSHPSLGGKGYATALLVFILRKLKLKLLLAPDDIVTKQGRNAILKVHRAYKVKCSDASMQSMSGEEVERILLNPQDSKDAMILHEDESLFGRFLDNRPEIDHRLRWHLILGGDCDVD